MRRNPRYVVINRRRRRGRRMRRNFLTGVNWMGDVVTPVLGGTAGFVAARVLGNAVAKVGAISNTLGGEDNAKIAANVLGMVATLGFAGKVPILKRNQGAIITGMGLALADRLLGKVGGPVSAYLGEYFEDPRAGMGEYFEQPLGAYVSDPGSGMGEYIEQPVSGLGTMYATAGLGTMYATAGYGEGVDPADQGTVDRMMDAMEATAGVEQAAAGIGAMYATAGLGAALPVGRRTGVPMVSTETPTDMARRVTHVVPADRMVSAPLVAPEASTPEGRGYAGGLFARHLFAGMMGA